ncbi:MAG: helix-turn-helix domain-containing protein [Leptolyngbyaceae cyanobacterium CSU_1_4]|nr:helix-turn-helix domain-containing protein [Leptolyngbyaceae cyanobacterium CSU_1_4]
MRTQKYEVKLKKAERSQLLHLTKKGKATPRQVKRARILLLAHEGIIDSEIAVRVEVTPLTCINIRKRFQELRTAVVVEKARPGRPAKFSGDSRAKITALACSEVPQGRGVWTLSLLADKAVELGFVESISRATVQRTLKK